MDSMASSYDDVIPSSHWITEEGLDTLIIELPGFRRENLRIQLDNYGNLKTSGERPIDGNRWRRFRKEFRVPENCNACETWAKLESGLLTITFPKRITKVPAPIMQAPECMKMKQPEPEGDNYVKKEKGKGVSEKMEEKWKVEEISAVMVGMQRKRKQLLINFAVAAVITVGVGIFVAYKFKNISEAQSTGKLVEYFDEFLYVHKISLSEKKI